MSNTRFPGWVGLVALILVGAPRLLPPTRASVEPSTASTDATRTAEPPGDHSDDGLWWSFRPIADVKLPIIDDEAWSHGQIDHFVSAKLKSRGLSPAAPADRRTLIRRLTFDLIGLPPTPEEVTAFASDESPDAYEKLVDRLLRSPHYGERWARHWFDLIRFGESDGFEHDKLRPEAWRYRDWVIAALNDDMPYDRFVRWQLAGDCLAPDDPHAVVATGFLVAGPWDEVGQTQQSDAMKALVREEEMEGRVSVVAQTFLGMTVHCARCHDHEFDPISQADYYRFAASLRGVKPGVRESLAVEGRDRAAERVAALAPEIEALRAELAEIEAPVRRRLLATRPASTVEVPVPVAAWDFESGLMDPIGGLHAKPKGAAAIENGRLVFDGKSGWAETGRLSRRLTVRTVEVWVELESIDQVAGVFSVESLDGRSFDGIVHDGTNSTRWVAGSEASARTRSFAAAAGNETSDKPIHFAIVYRSDYTVAAYLDGRPYGKPFEAHDLKAYRPGQARFVFGRAPDSHGGWRYLDGAILRARVYDRALSAEQVAASAGVSGEQASEEELLAQLTTERRERRSELITSLSRLEARTRLSEGGPTYSAFAVDPGISHLLLRGDPRRPGAVVVPGAIGCVPQLPADFSLSADATDEARRVALADWITDARNPLTPRVIANRIWRHHFGIGLVDTPNDFGAAGSRPSHPALLDWLAGELVRHDWSLKWLHKAIVMSATYRQSATYRGAAAALDAKSRWLWRKPPRRLEAEAVRDALLAVSGRLNPKMGGPGYRDFRTHGRKSLFYAPSDPTSAEGRRRSIYRTCVRTQTDPLLETFDCPDASTVAASRTVTTTPVQSLALWNASLTFRMADAFAFRLRYEVGEDPNRQIHRAYALAFGRVLEADELADADAFVDEHGLSAFCRVVLNSNEFLYVD